MILTPTDMQNVSAYLAQRVGQRAKGGWLNTNKSDIILDVKTDFKMAVSKFL